LAVNSSHGEVVICDQFELALRVRVIIWLPGGTFIDAYDQFTDALLLMEYSYFSYKPCHRHYTCQICRSILPAGQYQVSHRKLRKTCLLTWARFNVPPNTL